MTYSLAEPMRPFAAQLTAYSIQQRPKPDDTVDIVAVLIFRRDTLPSFMWAARYAAVLSMREQMQQDLFALAADLGQSTVFWDFKAESHYAAD